MQGSNISIPFYVIVAIFTVIIMAFLGFSYIDVRLCKSSSHRFEYIERIKMEVIVAFAFGQAVLLVIALVKHFITTPNNFFLKLILAAAMIGSILLMTLVNVCFSMFVSRVSVDMIERDLDPQR